MSTQVILCNREICMHDNFHNLELCWFEIDILQVTTLRFAVHFLMSNPDAQRKMQKEIDEEIGQRVSD